MAGVSKDVSPLLLPLSLCFPCPFTYLIPAALSRDRVPCNLNTGTQHTDTHPLFISPYCRLFIRAGRRRYLFRKRRDVCRWRRGCNDPGFGRPTACYLSLDWTLMAGSGERHHRMFTGFENHTFSYRFPRSPSLNMRTSRFSPVPSNQNKEPAPKETNKENKRKLYLSKISPICNPFGNVFLTISLTLWLLNQERFCYEFNYAA